MRSPDLADALIEAALGVVERWEAERHGEPLGASSNEPQRLAVLALGKLGGRELNLSSDVDLIFTFAEDGRTASGLSNRNFFTRVGQHLIEALHSVTEDGFTFRVDMRLRPYGGSGALVMDSAAMTGYFETQGRDWERYAFIKARPCAGDLAVGAAFLDAIEPFVYRRYLDFGAIDEMRAMKARRMDDRRRADDLKLGAGGIRDAEFCVQGPTARARRPTAGTAATRLSGRLGRAWGRWRFRPGGGPRAQCRLSLPARLGAQHPSRGRSAEPAPSGVGPQPASIGAELRL